MRVDLVLVDLGLRSEGLGERSLDCATAMERPRDGRGGASEFGRGEAEGASELGGERGDRRRPMTRGAQTEVEVRRRLRSGVG